MHMQTLMVRLCTAALLLTTNQLTVSQTHAYPERPIHIVVPFATGGGLDGAARVLGQSLSKQLGQPVIVDNKPGGNGIIATTYVARSKPDGYTIYLTVTTPYSMLPTLYKRPLGYDAGKDYTAIGLVAEFQTVLFTNASKGIPDLKTYVARAKAEPGKLTYASTGSAQILTLATELLKSSAGIDVLQIPFQGSAPALQAVVAGDVDSAMLDAGGAAPFIRTGKLTPLAALGKTRISSLPEVPTLEEAGLKGLEIPMIWIGIVGPGQLPAPIVQKLNTAINKALQEPEMTAFLSNAALTPLTSTPAELDSKIRSDVQAWGAVIRRLGLQLE